MSDAAHRLAAILPPDRLLTRPEHLAAYESDALTAFRTSPLAVAIPETTDEVVALVRFCHQEHLPFVARGSGTSLSGGSLPVADDGFYCRGTESRARFRQDRRGRLRRCCSERRRPNS